MDEAGVDFALVAWREPGAEGTWQVIPVPAGPADTIEGLEAYARRYQGESGALAFVSVADEFFVILRIQGSRTRLLLSDASAILDWPIAEEVADRLELDVDDEELDEVPDGEPAGDITILADFGLSAADLDILCSDLELYPDEQIGSIAARVGFGENLGQVLEGVQV